MFTTCIVDLVVIAGGISYDLSLPSFLGYCHLGCSLRWRMVVCPSALSISLSLSLWSLNKESKLQLSHKLTMTIIMVSLGETGTSHVKTVLNICGKSVLVLTDNWVGVALNKIKCQPKIFVWEGETIILICNFSNYNIFIRIYIFMH